MILELAHNISVIWPNQIQRNAHAQVYTNKTCRVINQWNWGWAERHVLPRPAPSVAHPIIQIALWSTWTAVEYQLHREQNSDIFRFQRHRETLEDLGVFNPNTNEDKNVHFLVDTLIKSQFSSVQAEC